MKKLKNKGIFIFIVLLVSIYAIIYIIPEFTGLFNVTYVADYGELASFDDADGYLVRNETVYKAVSSGTVNRLSSEGQLLRVGSRPIEISSGSGYEPSERLTEIGKRLSDYMIASDGNVIESGGLISYYVDGYEGKLNPETALELGRSFYSSIKESDVEKLSESQVKAGYPAFKIIDNTGFYIVCFIPKDHADNYSVGRSVEVAAEPEKYSDGKIPDKEKLNMTITSVRTDGDLSKLVLFSDRYIDGIGKYRVLPIRVINRTARGLMIEKSSIVIKEGHIGVYVKDKKGKYVFKPVEVLLNGGSNEDYLIITPSIYYNENGDAVKTVKPFDDVLKDPAKNMEKDS